MFESRDKEGIEVSGMLFWKAVSWTKNMNSSKSVLSIFMKLILSSRVAEKAAGEQWTATSMNLF